MNADLIADLKAYTEGLSKSLTSAAGFNGGAFVPMAGTKLTARLNQRTVLPDVPAFVRTRIQDGSSDRTNPLLLGDYGHGKTLLCEYLSNELCDHGPEPAIDRPLPILLRLGSGRFSIDRRLDEICVDAIATTLGPDAETRAQTLFDAVTRICVFLDGLDEFAGRANLSRLPAFLKWLSDNLYLDKYLVVISSRTSLFYRQRDFQLLQAHSVVYLHSFDDEHIEAYLKKNLADGRDAASSILANPALREVCRVPLHLKLLSAYLRATEPSQRADFAGMSRAAARMKLYQSFFEEGLSDLVRSVPADVAEVDSTTAWDLDTLREALCGLAHHWYLGGINDWSPEEFHEWLRTLNPDAHERTIKEITRFFLVSAFFIIKGTRHQFSHKSIMEYLVAELAAYDLLDEKLDRWEAPFNSSIWDHTYFLVEENGFTWDELPRLVQKSGPGVIGNLLLMAARQQSPAALPILRNLLLRATYPTLRCVCLQGIGLYPFSDVTLACLKEQFEKEPNSVMRKLIQCTLLNWVEDTPGLLERHPDVPEVLSVDIQLIPEDGKAIAQPNEVPTVPAKVVHESYRTAIYLVDGTWNAYAIPILVLGSMGDEEVLERILDIARSDKRRAVQEAYRAAYRHIAELAHRLAIDVPKPPE